MEKRALGGSPIRREFVENEFWQVNYRRFVVYARRLMAGRHFTPAGASEPADYVLRAAELILNGQRRCPDSVDPALCVLGVIRSVVSHDYERPENRVEHEPIIPDDDRSAGFDESLVSEPPPPDIESMVAARELADSFLGSIPAKYRHYVELRITQPGSADEHASALGLSVADIWKMNRSLRRVFRPRWGERSHVVTEIPLLPGTVLDSVLGRDASASAGVKKLRQEIRKELGSSDRGGFVSLGRRGSMYLEPAPLFTCLVTGTVWDRKHARLLVDAYRGAGLGKLLTSKRFQRAQSIAATRLQETLPAVAGANVMAAAVSTLFDLTTEDPCLHDVAEEMNRIADAVDEEVQELRRTRGTIVRFENGDALVVLERNGREQLREIPAELLLSSGLSDNGTPFMLHELTFSPYRHAQIALPAIDLEPKPSSSELRALAAGDTPLPRP